MKFEGDKRVSYNVMCCKNRVGFMILLVMPSSSDERRHFVLNREAHQSVHSLRSWRITRRCRYFVGMNAGKDQDEKFESRNQLKSTGMDKFARFLLGSEAAENVLKDSSTKSSTNQKKPEVSQDIEKNRVKAGKQTSKNQRQVAIQSTNSEMESSDNDSIDSGFLSQYKGRHEQRKSKADAVVSKESKEVVYFSINGETLREVRVIESSLVKNESIERGRSGKFLEREREETRNEPQKAIDSGVESSKVEQKDNRIYSIIGNVLGSSFPGVKRDYGLNSQSDSNSSAKSVSPLSVNSSQKQDIQSDDRDDSKFSQVEFLFSSDDDERVAEKDEIEFEERQEKTQNLKQLSASKTSSKSENSDYLKSLFAAKSKRVKDAAQTRRNKTSEVKQPSYGSSAVYKGLQFPDFYAPEEDMLAFLRRINTGEDFAQRNSALPANFDQDHVETLLKSKGQQPHDCPPCSGSGLRDCAYCLGEGWLEPPTAISSTARELERFREEFQPLKEAKKYDVDDVWSRPNLVIASDGYAQCVFCVGSGKAFCDTCEGSGRSTHKGFDAYEEHGRVFGYYPSYFGPSAPRLWEENDDFTAFQYE